MEIEKIITPRFAKILELIPKCKTMADIGTDHAYIPAYLVKKGIAERAIAMDIKEGPLERAESTIKKFSVNEQIELRLSDGLAALDGNEAEVIVIAGMGGLLINEILDANAKKHKAALFILQPMTAEDEVRKYLEKSGFVISDERLAREEDKIYHVLAAHFGNMKIENELDYYLGSKLFENNDENLAFAISKLIKKFEVILSGTKEAKNIPEEKIKHAERMICLLNEAKKTVLGEEKMEFKLLLQDEKSAFSAKILEMMKTSDNDFVPPLSKRSSTTQSDLKGSCDENSGILKYHEEMMKQSILGAFEGDNLLGFVSFRENYSAGKITEADLPNIYLSTLILNPEARGKGITKKMYDFLFNSLFPERSIFTRTWSTNTPHIKILAKFEFEEIERIVNDRGSGIDTVYFAKRRKKW